MSAADSRKDRETDQPGLLFVSDALKFLRGASLKISLTNLP